MPRPRGLQPLRSGTVSVDGGDHSKLRAPFCLVPSRGVQHHSAMVPTAAPRGPGSHSSRPSLHPGRTEEEAKGLMEASGTWVASEHTALCNKNTALRAFICWNGSHSAFRFPNEERLGGVKGPVQVHGWYTAKPGFLNPQARPLPSRMTNYVRNLQLDVQVRDETWEQLTERKPGTRDTVAFLWQKKAGLELTFESVLLTCFNNVIKA